MESTRSNIFRIEKASLLHARDLCWISEATFIETFSEFNTAVDMEKYISEAFNLEKIASDLAKVDILYFILFVENELAGYLKLNANNEQTEKVEGNTLEIERIYVLKQYHGNGSGAVLLQKAINVAEQMKVEAIWLGVWEKNSRAIRFYEKQNFHVFGTHQFVLGGDAQNDLLMRMDL